VICGPQEYIAISADRLKPLEYAFSEDRKLFFRMERNAFQTVFNSGRFKNSPSISNNMLALFD